MNQQVSQLSLYDIAGTPGVGADVSHINTRAQVKVRTTAIYSIHFHDFCIPHMRHAWLYQGYEKDNLADALRGADVVIIPAGVPRKPGMTRDDLFKVRYTHYTVT